MAISAMAGRYAANHDGNRRTGKTASRYPGGGPIVNKPGGTPMFGQGRFPGNGRPVYPGGNPAGPPRSHPGGHPGPPPFPQGGGQGGPPGLWGPGGGGAGYQGLDQIFQMLSGQGVNGDQFNRMEQGYTGANGSIGGQHGAFSGLSPYAMHFLATSGLLDKQQGPQQDTTGLTGDALFKANLMNQLQGQQPAQYKLHSGIDESTLQQMLGMIPQGAYAKGYNAQGRVNPMTGQPFS